MAGKGSLDSSDLNAYHNNHQNEREEHDSRLMQTPKVDVPKKKTTFKITSVTKSSRRPDRGGSGDLLSQSENDLDSMDDQDETSHTEDLSSEIFDTSSRMTDADSQDHSLLTPEEIVKEQEPKEKPRFRVVKVETKEPFKRGRWMCCDYLDAPDHKMDEISIKPGNHSTATSSVHYVHGADDPSKNPLLAGASGTVFSHQNPAAAQDKPSVGHTLGETFQPIQPAHSSHTQFSGQSSAYAAQPGVPKQPMGQSLPVSNRGTVPVLPPMQQGETQTSQSLSGNIPYPTPDGQSQQLPIPQSSMFPSNGHSQSVPMSVTSPHQPNVQNQDYVNAVVQGQGTASQDQHVTTYQQQMLYQDISSQQSGYNLSGAQQQFDGAYRSDAGPQLMVNGTSLSNLTSLRPGDGLQDFRPNLGAGLAQIAVGGITTATPSDDDVTEEANTSAVAIDNKIEQAMDLVKSHLMYAVREEVEVLREVIKELAERLHLVEHENKVLRSDASPDTLAKLPPPQPPVQSPLLQQFLLSSSFPVVASSSSSSSVQPPSSSSSSSANT